MKKQLRRLGLLLAGLLLSCILGAFGYVVLVSPRDAIYPTSVTCGCGHQEYLAFHGDRSLMWNAGHNRKDEYFEMHAADGGFDLLDWSGAKIAHVEFHPFYLIWEAEGHPSARIYREFNPIRFVLDRRAGRKEPAVYETIETKTEKILEYKTKNRTEPNKSMEPTPVNVTIPAAQEVAPLTSAAHLGR